MDLGRLSQLIRVIIAIREDIFKIIFHQIWITREISSMKLVPQPGYHHGPMYDRH